MEYVSVYEVLCKSDLCHQMLCGFLGGSHAEALVDWSRLSIRGLVYFGRSKPTSLYL